MNARAHRTFAWTAALASAAASVFAIGAGVRPAGAAELTGTVKHLTGGRSTPAADAVVWVPGVAPAATRSTVQPPAIASRGKRFEPHVLVVTRGATVTFPNVDTIFHNVFSRTPGSEFDLGLYRKGASRAFTFRSAGLVHLYCNIHAEMAAYVMIVDPEDAFAVTGTDGSFRVAGLPPGRHILHVWSEKAGETQQAVEVGAAEAARAVEIVVDTSTYRPLPHKNKYGKDYPPATRGADRY